MIYNRNLSISTYKNYWPSVVDILERLVPHNSVSRQRLEDASKCGYNRLFGE